MENKVKILIGVGAGIAGVGAIAGTAVAVKKLKQRKQQKAVEKVFSDAINAMAKDIKAAAETAEDAEVINH